MIKTALAALSAALLAGAAHASPILLVSNGTLMGAQGIELGGERYDVAFANARPGKLQFTTSADAWLAAAALRDLIFQGVYDRQPDLTNGCGNDLMCTIVTPYRINRSSVEGAGLVNTFGTVADGIIHATVPGQSGNSSLLTYAVWSRQARVAVPEPSTMLLTGVGLAALLARRRSRART